MSKRTRAISISLDDLDRAIVNRLQEGLPLVSEPFTVVANDVGCSTATVLERTERLLDCGVLTRLGPFFDAAAMGGAFCLCAMAVPTIRFDAIADIVNSFDEVAHNYERDHMLNMWFVLATETTDGIERTARAIEAATGIGVLRFPKEEEYFIGFRVAA